MTQQTGGTVEYERPTSHPDSAHIWVRIVGSGMTYCRLCGTEQLGRANG